MYRMFGRLHTYLCKLDDSWWSIPKLSFSLVRTQYTLVAMYIYGVLKMEDPLTSPPV